MSELVQIPLRDYQEKLAEAFLAQHRLRRTAERWKEDFRQLTHSHVSDRGICKEFRDWLFKDGIMIVRQERRMYLQFIDELESSKFILMYM